VADIEYRVHGSTGGVELASGLRIPAKFTCTRSDPDGLEVSYRIEFDDRRYVCTEVTVRGRAVTGESLRKLTVARDVVKGLNILLMPPGKAPLLGVGLTPPEGIAAKGATDEVLGWVARIYELATMLTLPPTKYVQDGFGISRATAGRWVAEARRRGLISIDAGDDDGQR
jgi:hypothetical protein